MQAQSAQPLQQEGAAMMDDSSRAAADAGRNAKADAAIAVPAADSSGSTPVASGKRTVIKETKHVLSRSEAVEKGTLPHASSESAVPATVMSQTADKEKEDKDKEDKEKEDEEKEDKEKEDKEKEDKEKEDKELLTAPPAPSPAPPSTAKSEVKTEMYGAEAQRADVMEARKRAYQLTSEIASERTENAKLREALREEKSKARAAARASKKQVEGLQRQAGLKFSNVLKILD
jgi:hypothetical protein